MNKVIAEFGFEQVSVLHGDHHIITSVSLKDGIDKVPGGCLLYEDGGKYVPLKATDTAKSPTAVALEDIEGPTSGAVANVAIHGAVRTNKLLYADGTPVASAVIPKLLAAGIYAIGALPPSAANPVVVSQPEDIEVAKGESAKVSVIASAPDGGKLTYKWYKNTTSSTTVGTAVSDATDAELAVDTSSEGTAYYYCEITNTLNNTTATIKTNAVAVKISAA
ncbi:MAG: hypothetical protein HDR37_08070 [Treponema sp.]|nr:hypothetical protein [Treponema sp.]